MKHLATISKQITATLALAIAFSLACQAQALNDIQNSFNNYRQGALQEKIFVHTDKSAYLTGEIIWFKLYVVDAAYNKPLSLSKVAYIDILDDAQVPLIQTKIALHNGK